MQLSIINGDLKHEFGEISKQEWHDTLEFLDILLKRCKVVLIKGNHDSILEPIARKKGLKIVDFYRVGDICILHGHKIFLEVLDKKVKTLIIGHDHPAISLKENLKQEIYKCFLFGKYKDKKIIVTPSFFFIYEGSDIRKEKMLSPHLQDLKNFEVFVISQNKVYKFGKLKEIN